MHHVLSKSTVKEDILLRSVLLSQLQALKNMA